MYKCIQLHYVIVLDKIDVSDTSFEMIAWHDKFAVLLI